MRRLTRPFVWGYWTVRGLYSSRLYYEDGQFEATTRRHVWAVMRPRPGIALKHRAMSMTRGHLRSEPCGCQFWFGRPQAHCLAHVYEQLGLTPPESVAGGDNADG